MHSIRTDRVHDLIEVKLDGFLTPEQAKEAGHEVREAILSLGHPVGRHLTLYDIGGVNIATAATIELLQRIFGNPEFRSMWARKVAFCTPAALARIQLQRLRQVREDIGIFETRGQALAWLLAKEASADPDRTAA